MSSTRAAGTDYGVDAPDVMRNFFLFGGGTMIACLAVIATGPHAAWLMGAARSLVWTASFLLAQGFLFLIYVKFGKFKHRDFMLALHAWRGDEQVLDVGCGRGLLLAGVAKRLSTGHAAGIDVWSNVDMGGNSEAATLKNLKLEGIAGRCTLLSMDARDMTFPSDSFDVIVSNLCLHNIYSKSQRADALNQIVRVLRPGGVALISDYKLTREYADYFRKSGLDVKRKRGSFLTTFPPLTVVIARKPA